MKICYLHIMTWTGLSIGASHFFGTLKMAREEEIQVQRKLTQAEATALNKVERHMGSEQRYKRGQEVGGFLDKEEVKKVALVKHKEHFPDTVLLQGDSCILDPQEVLVGPPEFVRRGNEIVAAAEANDWWEGDEKTMEALSKQWDGLLKEFNIER